MSEEKTWTQKQRFNCQGRCPLCGNEDPDWDDEATDLEDPSIERKLVCCRNCACEYDELHRNGAYLHTVVVEEPPE